MQSQPKRERKGTAVTMTVDWPSSRLRFCICRRNQALGGAGGMAIYRRHGASVLTKDIRRYLHADATDFNRPLHYPRIGCA